MLEKQILNWVLCGIKKNPVDGSSGGRGDDLNTADFSADCWATHAERGEVCSLPVPRVVFSSSAGGGKFLSLNVLSVDQTQHICDLWSAEERFLLWDHMFVPVWSAEGSGSVKAGGGGNAREIRIRKTKKKGRKDEDSDEETGPSQQSRIHGHWAVFSSQGHDVSVCTLSLFTEAFYWNKSAMAGWLGISPLGC